MVKPKKHTAYLRERARMMREKKKDKNRTDTVSAESAMTPPSSQLTASSATKPLPPPPRSVAKRKLLLSPSSEIRDQEINDDTDNIIISKAALQGIVSNMLCSNCSSLAKPSDVKYIHHQIDVYVKVMCDECGHVIYDESEKTKECKRKNFHPKTLLFVYAIMLLGHGYTAVDKLLSFLNFRKFSMATYVRYARYITHCAVENTQNLLKRSREVVFSQHDTSEDGFADVTVSFDGTWHNKRGHKSNFGVGAVTEADSGLILDYETMSKYCQLCNTKRSEMEKGKISEGEYLDWLDSHLDSNCTENYEGSSGGMESHSAIQMWGRSMKYNLRYVNIVSDADSSAYNSILAMNMNTGPYEIKVEKWDCINHVAKRFGTGLREAKKKYVEIEDFDTETGPSKKKRKVSMGGRNKLTDAVIDTLPYYFQVSLNRKIGKPFEEMRNEILSTFYHFTSTDDKPQHHLCAEGESSWCFYNRSVALNEKPPSHSKMKVFFHLSENELGLVKKVYDRLTTDDMMKRCQKRLTQNKNESLHQCIRQICPKHLSGNKRIIDFAASNAVSNYNAGYLESSLCNILGIEMTARMKKHLLMCDQKMDSPMKQKGKMIKHILRHKKTYECNTCEKSFSSNTKLKDHSIVHSGEERHVCSISNKSYTRKANLVKHSVLHGGQISNVSHSIESDGSYPDQQNSEGTRTSYKAGKNADTNLTIDNAQIKEENYEEIVKEHDIDYENMNINAQYMEFDSVYNVKHEQLLECQYGMYDTVREEQYSRYDNEMFDDIVKEEHNIDDETTEAK